MRISQGLALVAVTTSLAIAACGDDGNTTPDADNTDADVGPSCTTTALGDAPIFNDESDNTFVMWSQPVTTNLGTGQTSFLNFEFYNGIENLSGTIDLTAGNQNNYSSCAACLRLITLNAAGNAIAKQYFQSGGSITLTESPFAGRKMIGSATDVTLTEVTIADDYTSTPVAGGVCLTLGSLTLNADAVPVAWTCAKETYDDNATCNCACGAHDPDCDTANAPVAGCTGTQVCGSNDTCLDVCNVLSDPPVTCPTGACGYQSADRDICYTAPTAVDPAALGAACASATPLVCAVSNTIGTGLCDKFEGDDLICRQACDDNADCTGGQVCASVVGIKGLCITPPVNDTCETATAITIGTPVGGSTGGAVGNYNAGLQVPTCTNFAQPGGDVVYSVVLTAGQTIAVALSDVSPRFDASVSIVGPGAPAVCNANPIVCLKGADAGLRGQGETFTYTAAAAGTYYLIVDAPYERQGGTFTLTVTSP